MRYFVISGALTSMCSLAALITFGVMPNNLVYAGIFFLLTKLYVNSYLAMLNARKAMRDVSSPSGSAMHMNGVSARHTAGLRSERGVDVHEQFLRPIHEGQSKPYGLGDNRPVEIGVGIVRDEGQVQEERSLANRNSWLLRSPNKAHGKGKENSNKYVSQWL
ncbi:hypothetical protein AX15_005868 [Amanita polypyramis BW_CC]|nr:hypothetical protein AX15_005868 [Amanita polypyramis BW_CC]